jgi:hypothetical protein
MIEKFLKAKHWQLFLLTFGIPMVFQFVMMGTILSNISSRNNPDPSFMIQYLKFIPIGIIFFMGILFGWYYSIAIGLQSKIPGDINMKVKRFKLFFFIPLIYIFFFFGFFMTSTAGDGPSLSVFAVIVPLHLFSMFCILHSLYFVAKTVKTAELQREAHFADFVGEFFMIWFYPIGIWIIQPRINKILEA